MKNKLKIGIVGCGAIGSYIAKNCDINLSDKIEVIAINDKDRSKVELLVKSLKTKPEILKLEELIKVSDLVVEAASKDVSALIAREALSNGKPVMIMSVGGLLGNEDLFKLAEKKNVNIFLPTGAICGLDGLKAAAMSGIEKVVLTTKKPKKGLLGAPYLKRNKIDLDKIDKDTVLFEGTASEAVKGFPKNVNVAALLSLAGIGPEKTRVKIIVSPSINRNIHEIQISGSFGTITTKTENVPSPDNPKTSFLAALSAVATLKNVVSNIKIGT